MCTRYVSYRQYSDPEPQKTYADFVEAPTVVDM